MAVQECPLPQNNPAATAKRLGSAFVAHAHKLNTVSLQHATVQRRYKESIVITTDSNAGPEENVTQMMTHKSQATVLQPMPRDSL